MKKKLLTLIIAVLSAVLFLVGCSDGQTTALSDVGGDVKSGNGTFLVEKGNYLYFINGENVTTSVNDFGTPVKSSLVRVKKTELDDDLSDANVETVVPKIMLTGTYNNGVYFYGDYVYYATPSTEKDKTGTVRSNQTEFNRLNLKDGKADSAIAISEDNTCQYFYAEANNKVYLFYTFTEKVDDASENKFKVVDATNGDVVYTSDAYSTLTFPDNGSKTVFFTKTAYSNELEQNESFNELYAYTAGSDKANLVLSGAGEYGLGRDGRKDLNKLQLVAERGIQGVTISLIKNTGKYVIYKIANLDSSYSSTVYYGAEIDNGTFKVFGEGDNQTVAKKLGDANEILNDALTANSFYRSLEEIYYIDSDYGLIKLDYTNPTNNDTFGAEIISSELKNLSIISLSFTENNKYMYLCNTAEGFYYRADLNASTIEAKKINALAMQTPTDFYKPRVIDDRYFIGSYSHEAFYKYVYVIDMKDIDKAKVEGEDLSVYEKYLEDTAEINRENILKIKKTLLGKMDGTDKDAFDNYLETNYPEE